MRQSEARDRDLGSSASGMTRCRRTPISFCWYTRLAPLWVFDGEEGEHSVEIEVLEEQPDRSQVKREDVNTPKYDGTWFQPCQIMVVGRILK